MWISPWPTPSSAGAGYSPPSTGTFGLAETRRNLVVSVSLGKALLLLYCTAPALANQLLWLRAAFPSPSSTPPYLQYSMWAQLHLHPNIPRMTQSPRLATAHSTIPGLPGFQTTVGRKEISPVSTFSRSPGYVRGWHEGARGLARVDCPEVPLHVLHVGRDSVLQKCNLENTWWATS